MEAAPKYHLLHALHRAEKARMGVANDIHALELGLGEAHDERVRYTTEASQLEDALRAADVSPDEIRAAKDVPSSLDSTRAIRHVERGVLFSQRSPIVARDNS